MSTLSEDRRLTVYSPAQTRAHLFFFGLLALIAIVSMAFVGLGFVPFVVHALSDNLAFLVAGMIGAVFCILGVLVGLFFGGLEL